MIDFWAAVGRFVVDEAFHKEVFARSKYEAAFKDLEDLQAFLCGDHKLRLSRRAICLVSQVVKERYEETGAPRKKKKEIKKISDDTHVLAIRKSWPHSMSFPGDIELCAIIGLTCFDTNFRGHLFNGSSSDPKKLDGLKNLVQDLKRSPAFRVGLGELTLVNEFIRADKMVEHVRALRQEMWVPPEHTTCETGYTQTVEGQREYIYISETDILANPELLEMLQEAGAARPRFA